MRSSELSTAEWDPGEGRAAPKQIVVPLLAANQSSDLHLEQWSPWLQSERDGMSWIKIVLHSGHAPPCRVESRFEKYRRVVDHRADMAIRGNEKVERGMAQK